MTDPEHPSSTPIIKIVHEAGFPKYDRYKHSAVFNGNETGVCLRPEAFRAVAKAYPEYAKEIAGTPKRHKPENRKKQNALRVRLDDKMYATVQRWMQEDGYKSAQDFLSDCIFAYGISHGKDFL